MTFFRWLGKALSAIGAALTWLRNTVLNLIFILVLIFLLDGVFSGQPATPITEDSTLLLELRGNLVDQYRSLSATEILTSGGNVAGEILLRDLIRAIDGATKDSRITRLFLDLQYFNGGGISKLEELGQALDNFKASGKTIVASADYYSQAQYYLASYANEVYLNPMGGVLLTGFGGYLNYYQGGLEKLGVNVNIFRVGTYKDAIEPYTRNGMSEESREHNSQWINELWSVYTSRVESQRGLPKDALNNYINEYDQHLAGTGGNSAQLARDKGLVDKLLGRDALFKQWAEEYGEGPSEGTFAAISLNQYLAELKRKTINKSTNTIAVIIAAGTIYDGRQNSGAIGGDSLAELIRNTCEEKPQAIVLRIDSGGGSAFASEVIRQQLLNCKEAGLPLLVSMGSVAASGGYWIAANADEVWATPTTLTGSIGVYSIFPTFEKTLAKLGITTDGIGTTELASSMRPDMALNETSKNILQQQAEFTYRQFLNLVASGRDQQPEDIDTIAQGRVWSGNRAQSFGLVDELGGLNEAVAAAAQLAGVSDYRVQYKEPPLPFSQVALQSFAAYLPAELSSQQTHPLEALWQKQWAPLVDMKKLLSSSSTPLTVVAHCLTCQIVD